MNNIMYAVAETPAKLCELMEQLPDPRLLPRLQMLFLLATRQAWTRQELARRLGVHRESVGHWLTLYSQQGLPGLLRIGKAPGAATSLPAEVVAGLREKLAASPEVVSYRELWRWVEATYQLKTTYRVVRYTATVVIRARLAQS